MIHPHFCKANGARSISAALLFLFLISARADVIETDICVYGGTSSGVAAAIQASRMARKVVIAEFGEHLGGLSSGGLGATDIGNKAAIGGTSREFYRRLGKHYGEAESWKFEPHVAEETFRAMCKEASVPVFYGQRLRSLKKHGARITEIVMENGNAFRAKIFIDCSYEGDLMAKAKVSYHVGRESNSTYNETLNGVRGQTPKHQFTVKVDPYRKPGDPGSGLLPFIQSGNGGVAGDGDRSVQAYNYRLCFTTNAANRAPLEPPPGYDPAQYELLARYLEVLVASGHKPQLKEFWNPIWMPNQKTDINNNGGFSTDFIGANYAYPEADYDTRARIRKEHENYTRGFLTFLATSPRVPENIRREMRTWGPCKDEFHDTAGWPHQIYVREARRMISDYVMTEHDCRGTRKAADSVALGAYNMDSHNCQRIVKDGHVENEGDVQVGVSPYPISYRSIVPKESECENLFVPVCLAASHIAYGSIRMEPVFMILGQSAATAASFAIDKNIPVQKVGYPELRKRLLADKQVLDWTSVAPVVGKPRKKLEGIVIDDLDAQKTGDWVESNTSWQQVGSGYVHDNNTNKGSSALSFTPQIPEEGQYELILIAPPFANRATNVPVTISIRGKQVKAARVNQQDRSTEGFTSLGKLKLPRGTNTTITIANNGTSGFVVADGVQLIKQK